MKLKMTISPVVLVITCFVFTYFTPKSEAQVTGGPPSTSLPTSADGGALGSGQLNFQPDLFTGRFIYTVPIAVPPARQHSEPKLALQYNSSVGNGWCGIGWTLEVGKIERETRYGVPLLLNTNGSPVQYDDSKSFSVDFGGIAGDLVRVSSAGQSPVEYRLQVDKSFLKFLYYTNVAAAYWCVIDKSGVQYFFGESAASRLDNPNLAGGDGYGTNTFRWALDKILDPNGNLTVITYTSTGNQLYPAEISYDGNVNSPIIVPTNTIQFAFVGRSDSVLNSLPGFEMGNSYLLSQIVVMSAGQKVRRYALGYNQSPSTFRSLLSSVTEFGTNDTSSLPPVTFNYQVQQQGFGPMQSWAINSQGETSADWNSIQATSGSDTYVQLLDIDGDGLPDRVMRKANSPYDSFIVQRNTGTNFEGNYSWGGLDTSHSGYITAISGSVTKAQLFDINGDGRPDYVMANNSTSWLVQTNTGSAGTNSFSTAITWTNLASGYPDINKEDTKMEKTGFTEYNGTEEMIDMNGDGLPDRLLSTTSNALGYVQYNLGTGFSAPCAFTPLGNWSVPMNHMEASLGGDSTQLGTSSLFLDINGDGLPDFLIAENIPLPPFTNMIAVGLNTGMSADFQGEYGWEWTPIQGDWNFGTAWEPWQIGLTTIPYPTSDNLTLVSLTDINGDGLVDRVLTKDSGPFTSFEVQLNNGQGFQPLTYWTNVLSESGTNSQAWDSVGYTSSGTSSGDTSVALVDINGDGLPDRVMTKLNSPYTNLWVQLNLGPFPDLLCCVSNGIGGSVSVTYLPSTKYDNTDRLWTNSPWASGAKSLLPFPEYTVSSTVVNDGMGNLSTNTYTYVHGMFDHAFREFRGFGSVTNTDPYGAKTVTYFHQSGGFDNSVNGEFQDQGSFSKKGMPFRVEKWGTNGLLYQLTLNKVVENILNTNGWYFPCVTQTVVMDYEGLSTCRATAEQFIYDTNTENLVVTADLGEVTNVVVNGQTFTDIRNDSIYGFTTYASIGSIINKPSDTKITSDSGGANRLRESLFSYDSNGNLTTNQAWLNTAGGLGFITTASTVYDQYGNPFRVTDAAGITTVYTYDSVFEQYPVTQATGTFTTQDAYDPKSGLLVMETDSKGLVSSNNYDVFFRPIATYISTNAYGTPSLWKSKTSYFLGGTGNSVSSNCVFSQVNNAVDEVNGYQTYTYSDGLGRSIESRAEAENGEFRVANTLYDLRGKAFYGTLTYFSPGTNYTIMNGTYLGSLTDYDSIARSFRSTPGIKGSFNEGQLQGFAVTDGDNGSPVGPSTVAFSDGNNPWAEVATDSEGKVKKTYLDAYSRTIMATEVTSGGNINTSYAYDLLNNLTNVTDNVSNVIQFGYDSLGRKVSMVDPDKGVWTYSYDYDGRLVQQIDARTNKITFNYVDQLGRLTSKQIYNSAGSLVGTVTYAYDTSGGDPNYTVLPGQLYKVTDLQGYERYSYDVRGRVLKRGRFLNINAMEYTTQTTYDDADRIQQITYPGNAAVIQYSYDAVGHTEQVESASGTGANEMFYIPSGFSPLDQLMGYTNGNGVVCAYSYYTNSGRLLNSTSSLGTTNYLNLTYSYDSVSNVKSVSDSVNTNGGLASGTLSNIAYDDLHRLISLTSTVRGNSTYGYDSIGNILTNVDFGSSRYQYGPKPHAVTNANGTAYSYDACGNMISRGNQTLAYDQQNQLINVATTNDSVSFGYDDSGERLWRAGTNGYAIWIGGIYEINDSKVLCHVIVDGKLIASFEPQCDAGLSQVIGERRWYALTMSIRSFLDWPLQKGRGPITGLVGFWAGIIGICLTACRYSRMKRHEVRRFLKPSCLFRQTVTCAVISAVLLGGVPEAEATTYVPVFYYYHTNNLGSSTVLTDRSGNIVQQYQYSAFGTQSYTANTSAFPISNRYTGQITDDETGLYYYGARYYDPQLGRFIQPDAMVPDPSSSQSLNRYSYVRNNPLNVTDPSGRDDDDDDSGGGIYTYGDINTVSIVSDDDFNCLESLESMNLNLWTGYQASISAEEQGYFSYNLMDYQSVVQSGPSRQPELSFDLLDRYSGYGGTPWLVAMALDQSEKEMYNRDFMRVMSGEITWDESRYTEQMFFEDCLIGVGNAISLGMTFIDPLADPEMLLTEDLVEPEELELEMGPTLEAEDIATMRNVAQFQGLEVRAVRDLSHLDQETLEAMQLYGFAGTTKSWDTIVLHHLGQNPAGPVVEMPSEFHSIGNEVQHPFGNTSGAGLSDAQRAAFDDWRTEYWQWRATEELNTRRVLGN